MSHTEMQWRLLNPVNLNRDVILIRCRAASARCGTESAAMFIAQQIYGKNIMHSNLISDVTTERTCGLGIRQLPLVAKISTGLL